MPQCRIEMRFKPCLEGLEEGSPEAVKLPAPETLLCCRRINLLRVARKSDAFPRAALARECLEHCSGREGMQSNRSVGQSTRSAGAFIIDCCLQV